MWQKMCDGVLHVRGSTFCVYEAEPKNMRHKFRSFLPPKYTLEVDSIVIFGAHSLFQKRMSEAKNYNESGMRAKIENSLRQKVLEYVF